MGWKTVKNATVDNPNAPSTHTSVRSRARTLLLSWRRLTGIAVTLLGVALGALHWGWIALDYAGRLLLLWQVAESLGGTPAMVARVLSSWEFALALIVIGLAYTIFVGEPKSGVVRHPSLPYLALALLIVCIASIAGLSIYGAIEVALRQAYAAGVSGLPRGTSPSNPNTPTNQQPLYAGPRTLTADQQRILIKEGATVQPDLNGAITIAWLDTDNESYQLAALLRTTLARAAIQTGITSQALGEPGREGIMIEITDPHHPSQQALELQRLLLVADISAPFVPTGKLFNTNSPILFVGPRPLQAATQP